MFYLHITSAPPGKGENKRLQIKQDYNVQAPKAGAVSGHRCGCGGEVLKWCGGQDLWSRDGQENIEHRARENGPSA